MRKGRVTRFLIIAGCVFLIAAVAVFVGGMSAAGWDFSALNTVRYEQREFWADEGAAVESLNVRYGNADVIVRYSAGTQRVRVSYPERVDADGEVIAPVTVRLEGGVLTVTEGETEGFFGTIFQWNLSQPVLTVELPAQTACALDISTGNGDILLESADEGAATAAKTVRLTSGNGDVRVAASASLSAVQAELTSRNGAVSAEHLSAASIELHSDNGRVNADAVSAVETLTLKTDNGKVTARGVSAAALECDSDNGSIRVEDAQTERIVVTTDNGDAVFAGAVRAAAFACETETGDIRVEEGGVLDADELTLTTDTGDIEVRGALAGSRGEYTLFIITDTGSSNVVSGGNGARRLTATTDVGDIDLQFQAGES